MDAVDGLVAGIEPRTGFEIRVRVVDMADTAEGWKPSATVSRQTMAPWKVVSPYRLAVAGVRSFFVSDRFPQASRAMPGCSWTRCRRTPCGHAGQGSPLPAVADHGVPELLGMLDIRHIEDGELQALVPGEVGRAATAVSASAASLPMPMRWVASIRCR